MEKRSFNILLTVVLASMAIIGTYKITKKKNHEISSHSSAAPKENR